MKPRKLAVVPRELAAVDDDAADGVAVAAHELGERMHHDIGAMIERPRDVGRGERVVDDQRNAVLVRDFRDRRDIQNVAARIADGLAIQHPGFGRDRFAEIFRIVGLDEYEVIAKTPHRDVELREGAAIERARGDNLVARRGDRSSSARNCAACPLDRPSAATPFSSDATRSSSTAVVGFMMRRVDVAEFLQTEQTRGVLGIFESERRRLIDRHGAGMRGGIRIVAGVQRARIETEWAIDVFGGHSAK